ncbi:phosphotransferase [Stackebrandtia soli]|uniref:phosphotransferase n=1 Tax=Stackebrandtia soli TaxID=1892856 RepID=UPI0039EC6FD0
MRLLARGRTADVYLLDHARVLRRYRDGEDAEPEARLMTYLGGHGYPVPRVFDATGSDLVMERLAGPTMLEDALSTPEAVYRHGETLAELHNRLHAVRAPTWLPRHDDAGRVLHLDFHPGNVVLTHDGPVVIDWGNAMAGDPRLDVADTSVLLRAATVELPGVDPAAFAALRKRLLDDYLGEIAHHPTAMLATAIRRRVDDPNWTIDERSELRRWLSTLN